MQHLWRDRKTGPCFPLAVARCATHRVFFTLYPPGHVPYGRKRIAPVAFDGQPLRGEAEARDDRASSFRDTYFDAALDAARGRSWTRECPGGSDRWWGTQGRHLRRSVRWTGVAPGIDEGRRLRLAQALGVQGIVLVEGAGSIRCRPGYRSRGRAVARVLAGLGRDRSLYDRLALAGHVAGLWGEPVRFDPGAGIPRRRPFRTAGSNRPPPGDGHGSSPQ